MGGGVVKSKMIFLAPQILSLPVLQKLRSVYFLTARYNGIVLKILAEVNWSILLLAK